MKATFPLATVICILGSASSASENTIVGTWQCEYMSDGNAISAEMIYDADQSLSMDATLSGEVAENVKILADVKMAGTWKIEGNRHYDNADETVITKLLINGRDFLNTELSQDLAQGLGSNDPDNDEIVFLSKNHFQLKSLNDGETTNCRRRSGTVLGS